MSHKDAVTGSIARVLQDHDQGMPAVDLINAIVDEGNNVDEVVIAVRDMLNTGDVGLSPEMTITLLKQMA